LPDDHYSPKEGNVNDDGCLGSAEQLDLADSVSRLDTFDNIRIAFDVPRARHHTGAQQKGK
jgi:hypothetical protein